MTLRYRKGMTFGEFQAMIAEHQRDEAERRSLPTPAELECEHPFDASGLEVSAHKGERGVLIKARYRCTTCGGHAGQRERLLPFRKATVQT